MGKFFWLLGGTVLALAAFAVLNEPDPAYGTASDDAADRIGGWGNKQRAFGLGGQVKGKVEQGVGSLTGNENLSNQGAFDETVGAVRDAAGKAARAVENTVRKVNS